MRKKRNIFWPMCLRSIRSGVCCIAGFLAFSVLQCPLVAFSGLQWPSWGWRLERTSRETAQICDCFFVQKTLLLSLVKLVRYVWVIFSTSYSWTWVGGVSQLSQPQITPLDQWWFNDHQLFNKNQTSFFEPFVRFSHNTLETLCTILWKLNDLDET